MNRTGLSGLVDQINSHPVRGKMTEGAVQYALYLHGNKRRLYTNIATGCNEWDAIHISEAGYPTGYEIKLSRSDFRADFKKPRHKLISQRIDVDPVNEYVRLWMKPKQFYYVCHGFQVSPEDVPEYAGLMVVSDGGFISIEKWAPTLWKEKVTEDQMAFIHTTYANRYLWQVKEKNKKLMAKFRGHTEEA